jgi:hypothetical protein
MGGRLFQAVVRLLDSPEGAGTARGLPHRLVLAGVPAAEHHDN